MNPDGRAVAGQSAGSFRPRAQVALMACACAGASSFLFLVDPNHHAVYPQCLFHQATGLYCAGCGATRALYALLHGRVLEAMHDNVLFVGALPVVAAVLGFYLARTWRADAWPRVEMKAETVALWAAGIFLLMMVFMVMRNLPGFEILRPLS